MRLDKARRVGAGYVCLGAFHGALAVRAMLDTILHDMHKGLTEKEQEFVKKRAKRIHDEAELLRRLGWRFIKS